MNMRLIILIAALLLLLYVSAGAYQLNQQTLSSAGGRTSSESYTLDLQVSQTASGASYSDSGLMWDGFWGMYASTPALLGIPNAAKLKADGAFVCIVGAAISTSLSDLPDCIYVQDVDRISGIRVSLMNPPAPSILRGSNVNVIGNMTTTPSGERMISNSMVFVTSSGLPPGPLGIRNREIGRSGLSNIGVLVHCWGSVTDKGADFFVMDDGSGTSIRVNASELTTIPDIEEYVSVTGISSTYISDGLVLPIVLARDDNDVIIYQR